MKNRLKEIGGAWFFLIGIILVYIIILFVNFDLFNSSIGFFLDILVKVIPIFVLVFVLMAITNYFITPKFISKHIEKDKGIKKWIFAVIGGILSTGPIYMWYPLLADLKERGLSDGVIACFLYNRAIKIPLLPLLIFYFDWIFVIVLSIVMVFASIIQGIFVNKLMEVKIKK